MTKTAAEKAISRNKKTDILNDYYLAVLSRETCVIGRKEVLTGKAKFGIFGDGKEIAQIAYAKNFKPGDWRSGYYRDQTFMIAAGLFTAENFFAQLYGDTSLENNPDNGGRSFNNHFATRTINPDGTWSDIAKRKNSASDISPTAGQMPRLVGLGYASKLFRQNKELHRFKELSDKGNEVAFGMIGDSSTAEGHFFEAMNAAAVLEIPMAVAVWDDGYGISVPTEFQIAKSSISESMAGFQKTKNSNGIYIFKAKGWDYPALMEMFKTGIDLCRKDHVPVLFHVSELTQPTGHSTSGSHERYKSKERLEWEAAHDPLLKMRHWMLAEGIAEEKEINDIEQKAKTDAKAARDKAWKAYISPLIEEKEQLLSIVQHRACTCSNEKEDKINQITGVLKNIRFPIRKDICSTAKKIIRNVCLDCKKKQTFRDELRDWINRTYESNFEKYSTLLHVENEKAALKIEPLKPVFSDESPILNGREILRDNFEYLFSKYPKLVTFGEDTGKLGGVNQSLEGLQKKFGDLRITDTGIRETTILGQGIGLALRGLRPIAEIQYFDYLMYTLQTMSDDLATTHWRTAGGQTVPLIVRTRGHRFEGIWHSGSPLSMVINSIRGVYVCVPRDMTQAAGMYNTLLEGEDPALVVEPLKGYRLKEKRPDNIGEFKVPIGVPEVIVPGNDITIVTYGSCVNIAKQAVRELNEFNISAELIDAQTLLPFDVHQLIVESVKKTHRILFFDEDVPGGATAYMLQKVLEEQKGYYYLDTEPKTLTGADHRPAYSSDGDYFSNPNAEDVFEAVYDIMHQVYPEKYPQLY